MSAPRDHLATTSAYFDGELGDAEASAAADHIATCAECQSLLETAVGIDAIVVAKAPGDRTVSSEDRTASSGHPDVSLPSIAPPDPEPGNSELARRRSRPPRGMFLAIGGALAAAAVILLVIKPWQGGNNPAGGSGADPVHTELALAHDRVLEPRFGGAAFASHRPYVAVRGAGDAAHEAISLSDLAGLEQRGERANLVAALAATGELARAKDAAAALPAGAAGDADRAAVALAQHDPEAALEYAYRALDADPTSGSARWNLAIAARDLDLRYLARQTFTAIAEGHEAGWSDEARDRAAALSDELAPLERDFAAFQQRSHAMVAGGPPLQADDARRYPAATRIAFHDAVRLAPDPARLAALRPLAAAIDASSSAGATGVGPATAALDRVSPAAFGVRASFAADYRAVLEGRATAVQTTSLIDRLDKAGPAVADILVGTIIFTGATERAPKLSALVSDWRDPWFDLAALMSRSARALAADDLAVAPVLADALATCPIDAVALRCGQIALALASLHTDAGLHHAATAYARTALAAFRRAMIPLSIHDAEAMVANLDRYAGRWPVARAEVEDQLAAASVTHDCADVRSARIGLADLADITGAWARVREELPAPEDDANCDPDDRFLPTANASDLARQSRSVDDRAIAMRWIAGTRAASREPGDLDDGLAAAARLRIATASDRASATADIERWLALHRTDETPAVKGVRFWTFSTMIDDAGAAGDWVSAIAAARAEHPAAATARGACTLVASFDDGRLVVAAEHGGATPIGEMHDVLGSDLGTTKLVPDAIAGALRGCDDIAVIARPPLHGRADLLPPALPWYFVGTAAHVRSAGENHAKAVEVIDAHPPASLALGALPAMRARAGFDVTLAGDAATPSATLAALATATYAELHVHGVVAAEQDAAAFLALSPDGKGEFALRGDVVRTAKLTGSPTIVLAACRASEAAPYLADRWSLPDAFVIAGAGAVVAVDRPIDDATARTVFDDLRRRILGGEPVARAVAAIRSAPGAPAWAQRLMVFQ